MRTALVIGCADNVWDDVERAMALCLYDSICCVKLAGVHWSGPFEYWATLHPEFMDDYEAQRRANGFPGGYKIVAPLKAEVGMHGEKGNISERISYRFPGMTGSASSGFYGAKVMLDKGFDRVVVAGCPMTNDAHFSRGKPWLQKDCFVPGFEKALPHMLGKVRSMSGWSMEKLGEPTVDWLTGMGEPSGDDVGAMPVRTARG